MCNYGVKDYLSDESGAVTVDWVVLTATVVGLGLAVLLIVAGGVNNSSNSIDDQVEGATTVASLIGGGGAPAGFHDTGYIDSQTGLPIYQDGEGNMNTDGNTQSWDDYHAGGNYGTYDGDSGIDVPLVQ